MQNCGKEFYWEKYSEFKSPDECLDGFRKFVIFETGT